MSKKKNGYYYRPKDQQQNLNRPQKRKEQPEQTTPFRRTLSTSSGFEYELKAKNLQDMRFLDALVLMEDESLSESERTVNMIRVLRLMLGENQKDALYAHVVKLNGWASPAAVGRELKDIISNFDESKKK